MSTFQRSLSSERPAEDRGNDMVDNLRRLLPLVCVLDGIASTSKRVQCLNDLAKVIKQAGHIIEPSYPVERIIVSARLSLLSGIKEVRAGALRVLRYLLTSWEAFNVMQKHRIDLLVARSIDAPPSREIERLQAVRFVRQGLSVSPLDFPLCLISPIVSIVMHDTEPRDNLTWASMATLCELVLHNPELAVRVRAINALVHGLLKCHAPRITESIVLTLCYLLNSPGTRKFISSQMDIESLLAPITDTQYSRLVGDSGHAGSCNLDTKQVIEASKMAIVSLLKTWPGVFCLCNPKNFGMISLLNVLPLAKPCVQREILDMLYEVFQLKVPKWTSNSHDAVISIDPSQPKNEWSLPEGFVAEEGQDLLPPKTVYRTNLIDCYQAIVLAALLAEDLLGVLIETVRKSEREVMVMATIFLAQILHLTNVILPTGYLSNAHCLTKLVGFALDFNICQDMERNRATEVISCLDRVHQLKKQEVKPSSPFLKLILDQSGYFTKKSIDDLKSILTDLDETMLANLIKDTGVMLTKEYREWKWKTLLSFLEHPSIKRTQMNEDSVFVRFIKRLYNFFKPSNHLYSAIVYSEENSRCYSTVGQKLVKYLCRAEVGCTGYLFDLVTDLVSELSQVTASKLTADVFSHTSISHKLSRDYFLFLGTVSFYKPLVLEQCRAYGPLLDICNYQNRSDLMKLILSSLDFAHDTRSQVILSKLLTATEKEMRLYSTRHLRVLLRAKMPFFNSWALELLITQLYDIDKEVAIEAVDILDEGCEEESFLKALVLQQPQLLHLGEKGAALQTRFFSVKRGFALMSRLGYLESMQEKWSKSYNKLYVYIVEEKLAETLTSFKHTEDQEFVRRTCTNIINPKAFLPVHLYGQLAQLEEGCRLLDRENYVSQFAGVIRTASECTPHCDILDVKAAVWAIGHIGSAVAGLDLLVKEEVVEDLVELAERCPVLSIRGTAYYALCLISKTSCGAERLMELNWNSVCHSLAEKWPLAVHQVALQQVLAVQPTAVPQLQTPLDNTFLTSPISTPSRSPFSSLSSPMGSAGSFLYKLGTPFNMQLPPWIQSQGRQVMKESPTSSEIRPKMAVLQNPQIFSDSVDAPRLAPKFSSSYRSRPKGLPISLLPNQPQQHVGVARVNRTGSMTDGPMPSSVLCRSVSVRKSLTPASVPYLGVCLPLDVTKMFKFEDPPYKGFVPQSIGAPDFRKGVLPHDQFKCLECNIPLVKAHHHSQCDISNSNENLDNLLFIVGSPNNLSPEMRSRFHTTESTPSSESSTTNTPRSTSSGNINSRSSGSVAEVDSPREDRRRDVSTTDKSCLSPPKYKAGAVSNESDSSQCKMDTGEASDSSSKLYDSKSKPMCDVEVARRTFSESKHSHGNRRCNKDEQAEGEDTSKQQGILINIIGTSGSAKQKDPNLKESNSQNDNGGGGRRGGVKDVVETGSLSSQSSVHAANDRLKLHCAFLEIVFNLSSDVSLRKNITALNVLVFKYPHLCQDVCLYSKVSDLLSSFHYKLNSRRFIQLKFDKLTFSSVFAAKPQLDDNFSEEDFLSSACSSNQGSFCSIDTNSADTMSQSSVGSGGGGGGGKRRYRKRSSSDTTKFREKLQSLSRSVELQENLVTESPRERELEDEVGEDETEERGEGGSGRVNGQDFMDYPSDTEPTANNSNDNNNGGSPSDYTVAVAKEPIAITRTAVDQSDDGKKKVLNFSEKVRESSVYSAGFDL